MLKAGYTEPRLYDYNGDLRKAWYVGFRFSCPVCGVRKPYQIRSGLNYLKAIRERTAEGRALASVIKKQLAAGWNPHDEELSAFMMRIMERQPSAEDDPGLLPFNQALSFALERKKPNLADKSYRCFFTAKKYAQDAAIKLRYHEMPVRETKRRHVKELMDQICRDRQADYDKAGKGKKITGNFYNKYKGYLLCIFSELVEYDALEYNPCTRIKDKPEIVTNIHRHASQVERDMIKSTLQLKCPRFYDYLDWEYSTGIRPNELFSIRICDIDWLNESVTIRSTEGKTRRTRHVPIPNMLMARLRKLKLEDLSPLHYLFSNGFRPGEERKKRDYATKLWKELIKDGLGINVSLYSFKGLGGDDKRDAGISIQAVSSQYGHTRIGTTMIYTHGEKERMDKELREKSPRL